MVNVIDHKSTQEVCTPPTSLQTTVPLCEAEQDAGHHPTKFQCSAAKIIKGPQQQAPIVLHILRNKTKNTYAIIHAMQKAKMTLKTTTKWLLRIWIILTSTSMASEVVEESQCGLDQKGQALQCFLRTLQSPIGPKVRLAF